MSDNKQGRIECKKFSVDQKHHQRRFMLGVFAKAWFCQVRHAWLCLSAQFLVNTQFDESAWVTCNLVNRNLSETWILQSADI